MQSSAGSQTITCHRITVYFDPICAWSYIGHRSLFQAISLFKKTYPGGSRDNFDISWRPFYRDRTLPDTAVPLEERLGSALGPGGVEDVKSRVVRMGRIHGINFVFSSLIGNTRSFHQLVYAVGLSRGPDTQKELIERAYFHWHEVGCDITDMAFLLACASAVGFPEAEALCILSDGQYSEEVDRLDAVARADGVQCVPTFDINGSRVEGAEDTANFYQHFVDAKEKEASIRSEAA